MAPWTDQDKKLPSGLPEDFVITVREAFFGYPFDDNPDSFNFVLKGEQDVDGDLDDGELRMGAGTKFEPGDKEGTFAIYSAPTERGAEKKKVSKQSKYGRFFLSALEAGVPFNEEGVYPAGTPFAGQSLVEKDAKMWVGLKLRIHINEETFTLRQGPEKGKEVQSRQPIITEFLGHADGTAAPAPVSGGAAAANGAVTAARATELAKANPEYIKYLEAITAEGVDPSDEMARPEYHTSARS